MDILMKRHFVILFTLLLSFNLHAITISNVEIAKIVSHSDQSTKLILNGAGVRTKFFFDIYIGSLYLEKKANTTKDVVNLHGEKRISMHFLYKEIGKEKLISGWMEGFEKNLSATELKKFETQIKQFNALFTTVKKNDVINLNFIPTTGTSIVINNKNKGIIEGDDFFSAILKIWLGDAPADDDLKKALLGLN